MGRSVGLAVATSLTMLALAALAWFILLMESFSADACTSACDYELLGLLGPARLTYLIPAPIVVTLSGVAGYFLARSGRSVMWALAGGVVMLAGFAVVSSVIFHSAIR